MEIWHNPRCAKSRETLALLKDHSVNVVEYLKTPPTKAELVAVISKLGIQPQNLIRKSESIFKTHFKGETLTADQWLDAMIEYPKLIERPIVITSTKAIIGRPPSNVLEIL